VKRKVLTVALLPLLLAGCFGSGDDGTPTAVPTPSAASSSPTHEPLEPGDVYVDVDDSQGEGEYAGALDDVVASSCAGNDAEWTGSGTLSNSTGLDADYRVWVAFVDAEGDTVGLVQDNVDGVAPGETGDYSASMPNPDGETLTCVLRVERRVAA
jgi:hypothetical protein